MSVISLGKANKAKREIKKVQDRIGMNGTEQGLDIRDEYENADARLTALEERDPEVELYRRVGEVSAHTAINLNKHNLHVSSLLNQNRYKLTDMIVDDFKDDSGIDYEKSVNIVHDEDLNLVRITEGESEAELVTIAEQLDTPAQMIAISLVSSSDPTEEVNLDLSEGVFHHTEFIDGSLQLKGIHSLLGEYESFLIDLGDNAEGVSRVTINTTIPEGAEIIAHVAASSNGEAFTDYQKVNYNESFEIIRGKYIKVKVTLTGVGEEKSKPFIFEDSGTTTYDPSSNSYVVQDSASSQSVKEVTKYWSYDKGEIVQNDTFDYSLFGSYDEREVK